MPNNRFSFDPVAITASPSYINTERLSFVVPWFEAKPVVPGDSIPITWSVSTTNDFDLGPVVARVYLDKGNVKLYESPPTPIVRSAYLSDTGDQRAFIQAPDSGGTANDLYRVGAKRLRLDISSSKTATIFSATWDLDVRQSTAGALWDWEDPPGTEPTTGVLPNIVEHKVVINHPFTLIGRVRSAARNPNVTITGSVTLLESEGRQLPVLLGGTGAAAGGTPLESVAFTVSPNGQQEVTFAPLKKNWTWLLPYIWVFNFSEPRQKTFTYAVRIVAADSYGNAYGESVSEPLFIDVSVSDEKKGYADGALAALGVGVVVAIFTFGGGLVQAQAIANGLGDKALDPPEPDPRYRERVKLPPNLTTKGAREERRFRELAQFLTFAQRAVGLLDALGEIHGRMLGARRAGDTKALNLQIDDYVKADQTLQETASKLVQSMRTAVESLQRNPDFAYDALATKISALQRRGVSPDVRSQLTEQGCSEEALTLVSRALQDPSVVALARDVRQLLGVLAWSMAIAIRRLHVNAANVVTTIKAHKMPATSRRRKK
jgi:hypothetical protein